MHSEHLQNVRPTWVAFGWFAAAAVTGLALVILISLGLLPHATFGGEGWVVLAFAVGFFSGGWLVGWRTAEAPILHGVGIGLFSLVAWLLINLVADAAGLAGWTALSPSATAAALLLQVAAAVAGAWYGSRHHAVGV